MYAVCSLYCALCIVHGASIVSSRYILINIFFSAINMKLWCCGGLHHKTLLLIGCTSVVICNTQSYSLMEADFLWQRANWRLHSWNIPTCKLFTWPSMVSGATLRLNVMKKFLHFAIHSFIL